MVTQPEVIKCLGIFKNSETLGLGLKGHFEKSIENSSLSISIY